MEAGRWAQSLSPPAEELMAINGFQEKTVHFLHGAVPEKLPTFQ